MSNVITYINEKGGTGKTSICMNVGWELSNKDKKVLIIDLDAQKANITYFLGKTEDADKSLYDILKTDINPEEIILPVKSNLSILPATVTVADLNYANAPIKKMKDIIKKLKEKYDYILIDINPSPQWSHYLALSISDYVQIVMIPDVTSLRGGDGMIESIEEVQSSSNPNLKTLGIVFNMNDNTTVLGKDVKDIARQYAERLNSKIMDTTVRRSVAMREYVQAHQGVTSYAPKSTVAADIKMLAEETEREVQNNG